MESSGSASRTSFSTRTEAPQGGWASTGGCAKNEPAHNPRAHGRPPTVAPFRAWRGLEIPTSPEDSGPALNRGEGRAHALLTAGGLAPLCWPGWPTGRSLVWRRGWDLNPRSGSPDTRFPVVHLRPLGHLSISCWGPTAPRLRAAGELRAPGPPLTLPEQPIQLPPRSPYPLAVPVASHEADSDESGERGIRTPGTVTGTPDFESGAFGQLGQLSARRSSRFSSWCQAGSGLRTGGAEQA